MIAGSCTPLSLVPRLDLLVLRLTVLWAALYVWLTREKLFYTAGVKT